jgi:hypothetical protein
MRVSGAGRRPSGLRRPASNEEPSDGLHRYLAPSAPLAAALARYDATLERMQKQGRIRLPQQRTKKVAHQ